MVSNQDSLPFIFPAPVQRLTSNTVSHGAALSSKRSHGEDSWAISIRNEMDHAISAFGRPQNEDVIRLHKRLIKLIVAVLQPNSYMQAWCDLINGLKVVEPYAKFFNANHGQALQTKHYVERLYITYLKDIEDFAEVPLLDWLKRVFPMEFELAETQFSDYSTENSFWRERSPNETDKQIVKGKATRKHQGSEKGLHNMVLPDGRDPYVFCRKGYTQSLTFKRKQLTVGDLRKSFPAVTAESAANESMWKGNQSRNIGALATDIHANDFSSAAESASGFHLAWHEETILDLKLPVQSHISSASFESITGREAVEIFTMKKHLNHVQFMYFNIADGRYFRPYDLVSVPEDKVNPEHYVFSTFGVLHVFPDGSTSEILTLAEWNRMAVLWAIVSKIGFFRNFLLCKTLQRWKIVIRRQRLMRIRLFLQNNLILAVPQFGLALIKIIHLVRELTKFRMLPDEQHSIREYPLAAFSAIIRKKAQESDQMLELFFRLCNRIVDDTRRECFEQLKYYEYQMQHQNQLFNRESLFIQRKKNNARLLNLEKAKQAVRQLSTFISLVDRITSVHVLELVRLSTHGFILGVLCPEESEVGDDTVLRGLPVTSTVRSKVHLSTLSTKTNNDGNSISKSSDDMELRSSSVLLTKLLFNSTTCELEMHPSPENFKDTVCSCIENVVSAVSEKSDLANAMGKGLKPYGLDQIGDDLPGTCSASVYSISSSSLGTTRQNYGEEFGRHSRSSKTDSADLNLNLSDQDALHRTMNGKEAASFVKPPEVGIFGLTVMGEGIMREFNRTQESNLKSKLTTDIEIAEGMKTVSEVVESALAEISSFCEANNKWLAPIRTFSSKWSADSLTALKGKPARELESVLLQLKSWSDQVKNMDCFIMSGNRLLHGDCHQPQSELVATLSSIFKQMMSMITSEAKNLSADMITKAKDAVKVLQNKEVSIESFAAYARKVTECHRLKNEISHNVHYIRELYEVVRMTHRQLSHGEEKSEEKVKTAWEAFIFQLKDADNFISNQQPVILKQLNEIFLEKFSYIVGLSQMASSGMTMDPTKSPPIVIIELRNLIMRFSATKRQLTDLSMCREAIEGKTYNLDELPDMAKVMDRRLELWKYVNLSSQTINEWNGILFRRFDVQSAIDKVKDWQKVCKKLQEVLTESDPVLLNWSTILSNFLSDLPMLQKMSNPAVKLRHWRQIFTGLGQSFDPGWNFTVKDILSFNLSEHAHFINQVCHGAIAEFTLEQTLRIIKEKWEHKQFQLAKHIQTVRTKVEQHSTKPRNEMNHSHRKARDRNSKLNVNKLPKVVFQEVDSETYILVASNELLQELSDSHTTLQSMLQSRHAAEIRFEAEIWSDTFQRVSEIVQLWGACQDKWMYLNMVYNNESVLSMRYHEQTLLFEDMDKKYREFVKAVLGDPKVLSVLSRRHGQKNWRELQGDNLRKHILSCIEMQEELLSKLSYLLDEFRSNFPRMYFLCDEDCVRLLAISRQPKAFAPYIRKFFKGIKSVSYKMPSSEFANITLENNLDHELHSHRLVVTQVQGNNGEYVSFDTPLAMQPDAIAWLKLFESKLIQSLKKCLIDFLHRHQHGIRGMFDEVLRLVSKLDSKKALPWMFRYPVQILLLSESVLWTSDVKRMLKSWKDLKHEKHNLAISEKIRQCGHFIRNCGGTLNSHQDKRIRHTLTTLIAQLIYQRDVVSRLLKDRLSSADSFEWQRITKHSMDTPMEFFNYEFNFKSMQCPNCVVEHLGIPIDKYGMEYYSSCLDTSQSVMPFAMTSVSERTAFSLCVALQQGKCGTLIGPEATGKSALMKQMALIFGRPLINLNCTAELNVTVLTRALCGVVESSCWLCLDQAQCLPKNVLSVLAQQIHDIQLAYSVLYNSTESQYSIRGKLCKEPELQRSNSIPSLHSDAAGATDVNEWLPNVNKLFLSQLNQNKDDLGITTFGESCHSENFGNIAFAGMLLQPKYRCGLFMTLSSDERSCIDLSENMKLVYRPIAFIQPDVKEILKVWLLSHGFLNSTALARKIELAMSAVERIGDSLKLSSMSDDEISKDVGANLGDLRSIIAIASSDYMLNIHEDMGSGSMVQNDKNADRFERDGSEAFLSLHIEEKCLSCAMSNVLMGKFVNNFAKERLKESLKSLFPSHQPDLKNFDEEYIKHSEAINLQLQIDGHLSSPNIIAKVSELESALNQSQATILVGPAGCGKTTIYRTLAGVLNMQSMAQKNLSDPSKAKSLLTEELGDTEMHELEKTSLTSPNEGVGKTVDINVVYPNVLSTEDLYGYFTTSSPPGVWIPGFMAKVLHCFSGDGKTSGAPQDSDTAFSENNRLNKWIILDGEITASLIEYVNNLLDDNRSARLQNMDEMIIEDHTSIIFEVSDLTMASPGLLSRCRTINCTDINHWSYKLSSWLDSAYRKYSVTQDLIRVWKDLISVLLPQTLDFLSHIGRNVMNYAMSHVQMLQHTPSLGSYEVNSFLQLLSALMNMHLNRVIQSRSGGREKKERTATDCQPEFAQTPISDISTASRFPRNRSQLDDDILDFNYQLAMNLFGFAFVWSFGSQLLEQDMPRFDVFFRNLMNNSRHKIHFPIYENVFEYYVDVDTGDFALWEDKIDLKPHSTKEGEHYSYIHQIERYAYLSSVLLGSHYPVIVVGERGCGKSSMVSHLLQQEHEMKRVPISSGMTSWHLQKLIESHSSRHLKQHNIGLMAHPNAVIDTRSDEKHKVLFFLDDLSCACSARHSNSVGSAIQPVHELIRQILCCNSIYDKEHQIMKALEGNINFLAASSIPSSVGSGLGHSTHLMSPRLSRKFFAIHFLKPSKDAILSMYHNVVQSWLEEFPAYSLIRHYELSQAIIAGAFELYSAMQNHFKPMPHRPTYVFSLHDISHIVQGLFLLKPKAKGRPKMTRRKLPMAIGREDGPAGPRQRPLAGRAGGRFKVKQLGDTTVGTLPMMRTIIRMWLHECCRTFGDRLMNEADRDWFSKSLVELLKRHFCTAPNSGLADTPGTDDVTTAKAPTPSGISISRSSQEVSSSCSLVADDRTAATPQVIILRSPTSQQNGQDLCSPFEEKIGSSFDNPSHDALNSCQEMQHQSEDENLVAIETANVASSDLEDKMSLSIDESAKCYALDGEMSERNVELQSTTQESSDGATRNLDDEGYSLPATSLDLRTDFENQSVVTATTTADQETESLTSAVKSDDRLTVVETESSKSEPSSEQLPQSTRSFAVDSVDQPSSSPQFVPKRPVHGRPGGARFGVTFMPGLIDDQGLGAENAGPLVSQEQILSEKENPLSILFSTNILSFGMGGMDHLCESTEEQLSSSLIAAQDEYNENQPTTLDLVFFQQAIFHVVRLSRAISLSQCGHALCLSSTSFAGRTSLCRLTAYMCKATLFHVSYEEKEAVDIKERFRKYIYNASRSAALLNTTTLLLLDETIADIQCLQNLCCLVKEGQYPSLYSHEDLATLAAEISSDAGLVSVDPVHHHYGSMREKLDLCLELFFKRVVSNLHVVLLLKYPTVNDRHDISPLMHTVSSPYFHHLKQLEFLNKVFKSCPEFLTRFACIDFYEAWNHTAWMQTAESFLKTCSRDMPSVPWSLGALFDIEMSHTCHMMSYIHQDVQNQLRVTLPESAAKLVSPTTFRTMANLFVNIAAKVCENERKLSRRYGKVLRKIADAEAEVERYAQGKKRLIPFLEEAIEDERSWKRHVEQERREYTEAKERCNLEEEIIESLEAELDSLKQDAKLAFNKVNPLYNAAVETMRALTVQDLNELKRYKNPPESAVVVVKALCDLFDVKPANWENGKALLMRDNFYEELEFFDKDNIPESVYQALSNHVRDPEFQPALVARGSKTAEALCLWMHAVYSYAKMSRYLAPKIARLKAAEARMKKAQSTLGVKRVRCNQIKEELDLKIQKHKDSCNLVKQCEYELETLKAKITKAQTLMGNLAEYITAWRLKYDTITSRLNSAIGDSLLAAACCAYHAIMNQKQRDLSLQNWKDICINGYVDENSGMLQADLQQQPLDQIFDDTHNLQNVSDLTKEHHELSSEDKKPFLFIQKDFAPIQFVIWHTMHREWKKSGFSNDQPIQSIAATVLFANFLYQQCSWPLIFDPDGEFRDSIKDIVEVAFKLKLLDEDEAKLLPTNLSQEIIGDAKSERTDSKAVDVSTKDVQSFQDQKCLNVQSRKTTGADSVKVIVCNADSPILSKKLKECLCTGLVMVVTHIERAPLPTLRHLLGQKRQYRKESTILHPDDQDRIHENFRLFLCTSVNLKFVDGMQSLNLPMEPCLCIDFSLDIVGIEEKLVHIVMSHERPDLDSHIRLMETDILHLNQQREKLQSDLIAKVSSISGCILSDPSLLDAVRSCTRETSATDSALLETNMMKSNFLRKLMEVRDMMRGGTVIHQAVLQTSVLRKEFYYWTGSHLLTIFAHTMKLKMKKRKLSTTHPTVLSLKSRAAELSQSLVEAVLHSVKYTMFGNDYLLLTSVLALMTLVHQNKFTLSELKSFLLLVSDKTEFLQMKSKGICIGRPMWITDHVWETTKLLEERHTAFKGLTESLYTKQNLWREYFYSPPALLVNVPSDQMQHLNIGQKALLWKTVRPDMIMEIMSELSCSVLGQISAEPQDCNVASVLERLEKNASVVFFTSSQGVVRHPAPELRLEAKCRDLQLIEKSAPFGSDLASIIRTAMKNGYWLLLHECDLERNWPKEVVSVIYQLCDGQDSLTNNDNVKNGYGVEITTQSSTGSKSDDSCLESDRSAKKKESFSVEEIKAEPCIIHKNFRLWIIMKPNGRFMPEILLRKALIVNLTSPADQSSLMKRSSHLITLMESISTCEPGASASHIAKLEESKPNGPIKTFLSFIHALFPNANIIDNYKLYQFFADRLRVKGALKLYKAQLLWTEYFGRNPKSLDVITGKILRLDNENFESQHKFLEMLHASFTKISHKVNTSFHGKYLWDGGEDAMHVLLEETARCSSNFLTDVTVHLKSDSYLLLRIEEGFEKTLMDIANKINNLILPMPNENIFGEKGPLADYFCNEYIRVSTLIQLLRRDIQNCIAAVKGETQINPAVLDVINALLSHTLPQHWIKEHPDIFRFLVHTQIDELIAKLRSFVNFFSKYAESILNTFNQKQFHFQNDTVRPSSVMQKPPRYNLAVFLRPDQFLDSVLAQTALTTYSSDPVSFEVEVFQKYPTSVTSGAALWSSIIIDKINLCNAMYDSKNQTIRECSSNSCCRLPAIRLTPTMISNRSSAKNSHILYCPLHCGDAADGTVLVHIPLGCKDSSLLHLRKVHALASLE